MSNIKNEKYYYKVYGLSIESEIEIEEFIVNENKEVDVLVECEVYGTTGNVPIGAIKYFPKTLQGLQTVTNKEAFRQLSYQFHGKTPGQKNKSRKNTKYTKGLANKGVF